MAQLTSVLALGCSVALLACGARSALPGEGAGSGSSSSSGATSSSGAGGASTCMQWSLSGEGPVRITSPSINSELTGAFAEGHEVFVAANGIDAPEIDPTWRVRTIADDLSLLGDSQIVLSWPPNVTRSGLRLASAFGHRGAMAWDESQGCRFVTLADDGSAAEAPKPLGSDWCTSLSATPDGFTAFVSPNNQLLPLAHLTLDATGEIVGQQSTLTTGHDPSSFPLKHARFDDGTELLVWRELSALHLLHLDASGQPLAEATPIPFADPLGVALAALGSSALLAWTPAGHPGELWVGVLDEGGNLGKSRLIATPGQVSDVALAVVGSGFLLAWSTDSPGSASIEVQPLTLAADPLGAVITFPARFANLLEVVGTPRGAMLVYEDQQPTTPRQVLATSLLCSP